MDIGLLILRLTTGLTLAAHGVQKLFGWFGGPGLDVTGGFFTMFGFPPGRRHALAADFLSRQSWVCRPAQCNQHTGRSHTRIFEQHHPAGKRSLTRPSARQCHMR